MPFLKEQMSRRSVLKLGFGVVASATGLSALAGCGSSTPGSAVGSSGPVTLNLMTWGGDADAKTAFSTIKNLYPDALKNISLKVTVPGANDADVAKALRLALSARSNIPDLVQLNRTQLSEFATSGALMDLTDFINPVKNDLFNGALQLATYQGKIMAIPFQIKSKIFFYRHDLFEQAGISLSDLSTTEGYIAAGKKFHAHFPDKYIINLGTQPQQYILGEFLSAYPDVHIYDQGRQSFQLTTNPAFTEVFTFLKQIKDAGIALPIDDFSNDWAQAFKNEKIGGVLIGNWMKEFLPQYATVAQTGKWAVSLWPKFSPSLSVNESLGSEAGGSIYVIPAGAKNPDAAKIYMQHYLLDRRGSVGQWEAVGVVTPLLKSAQQDVMDVVNKDVKPNNVSTSDWALQAQNFFGRSYQELEFSSFDTVRVFDYDPAATNEIAILLQALENVLSGSASVASALQQAQNDMQSQIGNPYNS